MRFQPLVIGNAPSIMKTAHVPYLDGWRGIAILLVLGGHFFKLPASRLGVEVFFVLSGLLMSKVLFEANTPLGVFYKNRVARIFPTFYLFLGVVAIASAVWLPSFPAGQFFCNVVFLQAYTPDSVATLPAIPVGHLWSLNVEEHSYIFLSLVSLFAKSRRMKLWALAAAVLGCMVAYAVHERLDTPGFMRTECAALPLIASAALYLGLNDTKNGALLLIISAVGMLATIACSRWIGGSVWLDYVVKPLFLALMVNTLGAAPDLVHKVLSTKVLRWFGVTSFSLYLWQQPFYHWVLEGRLHPLVGLSLAMAVGACSYYFFENPIRQLIRRWTPGRAALVSAR